MQHCRCVLLLTMVLCAVVTTSWANAKECGGCLQLGCLECGPLAGSFVADPYQLPFCQRPRCALGAVSLDLVALERSGPSNQDIMFVAGNPVANADEFNFVTELGFRVDLSVPGRGLDFNVNIFGAGHDRATIMRDNAGITPLFFGGSPFMPAVSYTAEYVSDLVSSEVNVRVRQFSRIAPLAGLRLIHLDEHYNIYQTGTTTGFFSNTDNKLFGLQFGVQGLIWRGRRVRFETIFKAGAYYNDLDVRAQANDAMGAALVLQRDNSRTSFAGEWQIIMVYQFSPRMLLRVGYQGLWLGGVGLAVDQSDDASFGTGVIALDTDDVSYQGGFLGLEITW